MEYYMYETIKCPFCGENHAHIADEGGGLYQLNCTECHNAIFHQDSSWDNAVKFFKGLFIVEDKLTMPYESLYCRHVVISDEDIKEAFKKMKDYS